MSIRFNINSFKATTETQKHFDYSLWNNTVSIAIGEAGCTKTTRALQAAIKHLNSEQFSINKIVYVRPYTREYDEMELGAMPGTFEEKIMSIAHPIYSNLTQLLDGQDLVRFGQVLEVYNIATLKGMTLYNSFIIFDEAEDATERLFKAVITRIGEGSKMAILGDISQTSLKERPYLDRVAYHYMLNPIEDVGVTVFPEGSSVRHPIIPKIIQSLP